MSTRCNILIEYGASKVYLYRHCDGYPSDTGADLIAKMRATGGLDHPSPLIEAMLSERYEKQSYEPRAKSVYEVTSEFHGDIDYAYRIRFPREGRKPVEIGVLNLSFRSGNEHLRGKVVPLHVATGPVAAFVELVNAEIVAENKRLADMVAKGNTWIDPTPRPLVEKEAA